MFDEHMYKEVRIVRLIGSPTNYNGWNLNRRAPQVGDRGFLIDRLDAEGVGTRWVVEASASDGTTIWLADFLDEELELVEQ
jgi:hypothetical protein